jgi:carotenoid 1,2-hydratase
MTERGAQQVTRRADHFQLGPSQLRWRGGQLQIDINELSLPLPRRVVGKMTLTPKHLSNQVWPLSASQDHWWGPICTDCNIEVNFDAPHLQWQGHAYWDYNEGRKPINSPRCEFARWDWTRARFADGTSQVVYDIVGRTGAGSSVLALNFDREGVASAAQAPQLQKLPSTAWAVNRRAPVQQGANLATVAHTLEDTPFYCRNVIDTQLCHQRVIAMHESLDVARLSSIWVQGLLPFKMPRRLA